MRALFIYNESDLLAKIPGGVQICSQEFLEIIQETADQVIMFNVAPNRSYLFRFLYKLNLDNYIRYRADQYAVKLSNIIATHKITHVFINKAELLRFSKTIKQLKISPIPKVIIMSHGNESGDLLADIARTPSRYNTFLRLMGILKLGLTLYTESFYRRKFVDLVCTMSEEESAIERWLGINSVFFIPRLIQQGQEIQKNPVMGRFGYVGTLNHSPNLVAIRQLCEALEQKKIFPEIRIVGQPAAIGKELEKTYKFIQYLGPLSEAELLSEIKSWSFFINPIFNYSRGASMKLARAIAWEIPIITTRAGKRGYYWKKGNLIETADNTDAFIEAIRKCISGSFNYESLLEDTIDVKKSTRSKFELSTVLRQLLNTL